MTVVSLVSPTISGVSPQVVTAGTPSVKLMVKGANFDSKSAVTFNGAVVPTSVVDADTLAAQVGGNELSQPTVAHLKVRNSSGVESNPVDLTVTSSLQPNQPSQIAALAIDTTSLPGGQAGTAYSTTLAADGGTPSYTWSVSAGSLPAGLTLAGNGTISGTPTTSGSSNFVVTVTDAESPTQTKTASLSIVVAPAPSTPPPALTIGSSAFAAGQVGKGYSAALSASGGTPGYTWSLSGGSLPAGLSLSGNGAISGTPAASGTSSFTVTVSDSGSPAQTQSANLSLTVNAGQLTMTASVPSTGQTGTNYNAALSASGGTPGYTWSVSAGSLPAGLTLNTSTGAISGLPTTDGTSNFTVTVSDSGSPAQTQSAGLSITVSTTQLAITTSALAAGEDGTIYSAPLSASGGTPGYTWSITSGSLPAGLTLSGSGLITGTPTGTGTSSFTVQVADNSSPVQTARLNASITVSDAPQPPSGGGTTWYVRPDGGTRYSTNMTNGQCDGKSDISYTAAVAANGGTAAPNLHCAFKDVRYLWEDGSYTDGTTFPGWGWVIAGGDTVLIRGSIGTGISYRIGWNNSSDAFDAATNQYWGLPADPYDSGIPVLPSGTASQPTRILGENYASCSAASAKTQLHGGYALYDVFNLRGTSYVQLGCLDITDFSSCGRANQTHGCNTAIGSMDDFTSIGILWSNTSTNDTLTDVYIHGMAGSGMTGPTGTGVVMKGLGLVGNAGAGWNADPGDGTTGTGTLLVQNFNISWNGCAEEYPIVDALPYQDCTDDNIGGYGDGFGTTTVPSNPAWVVHFDQGTASYNTQDGLDALHLTGTGSSMTVTRTLAYGNMGQQIKVGGASGAAINNVIVTNCNAMRQAIPGTPTGYNSRLTDFCRAADTGIAMSVGKGSTLTFDFNTVYSASATAVEVDCDMTAGACDSTSLVDFRNNIFMGFLNNAADGYPDGGTGDYSGPIYSSVSPNPFTNPGSLYSNNLTYHAKSSSTCPAPGETNALCGMDPNLTDETWHLYGYGNMAPALSIDLLKALGSLIPSVLTDYTGATRGNPPGIGAYE